MCARFTLRTPPEELAEFFGLESSFASAPGFAELTPRFNIAPTQQVLAVRSVALVDPPSTRREWAWFRWGLIPSWAKDPKIGHSLINARSETAETKPAFRAAFQRRRCLIAADGFYEWKHLGKQKLPYHIRRPSAQPLAIAGLWETWKDVAGKWVETCTLLTTEANERLRPLHDRMPVFIAPADFDVWLDPGSAAPDRAAALLRSAPEDLLELAPANPWVNNPRHEDPQCLEPESGEERTGASPA